MSIALKNVFVVSHDTIGTSQTCWCYINEQGQKFEPRNIEEKWKGREEWFSSVWKIEHERLIFIG